MYQTMHEILKPVLGDSINSLNEAIILDSGEDALYGKTFICFH